MISTMDFHVSSVVS